MAHCVFCSIVRGDSPAEVVHEDEHTLGFMDALPMTPGHLLVIPKQHVQDLWTLPPELGTPLLTAASSVSRRLVAALGAKGVNLVNNNGRAADQTQFHIHFHLVPRYGGDRLLHPWERQFGHWPEIRRIADLLRAVPDA